MKWISLTSEWLKCTQHFGQFSSTTIHHCISFSEQLSLKFQGNDPDTSIQAFLFHKTSYLRQPSSNPSNKEQRREELLKSDGSFSRALCFFHRTLQTLALFVARIARETFTPGLFGRLTRHEVSSLEEERLTRIREMRWKYDLQLSPCGVYQKRTERNVRPTFSSITSFQLGKEKSH